MAKSAILLVILAISCCAFAYPGKKWDENGIKQLLGEAINKFVELGKKHSPINVGELPTHEFSGPDYDVKVALSNVKIWSPDVDIKKLDVKLTPTELNIEEELNFNNEIVKGKMRINGKMGGDDVDQTGAYEANWSDFTHKMNLKIQHDENSVTIVSMDFDADYALPKTTLTGFSFKEISTEDLEKHSSEGAHEVMVKKLEEIKEHLPTTIKFFNHLLKGHNLDQVLNWLDKVINPAYN